MIVPYPIDTCQRAIERHDRSQQVGHRPPRPTPAARLSRLLDEPAAIADDQPREGVGDLHMKMKTARLRELVGLSAWRQHPRQRNPTHTPAADHEPQALALAYQRHADIERAEPLADEPLEA